MKKLSILLPMLLSLLACTPVRTTSSLPDSASARATVARTQQYIVRQQLSLVNEGEGKPDKQNLWVALIRDVSPYQHLLAPCQGELPNDFTQAELHIESANPQIRSLSDKLSRGKTTVCDQVRAFYDYAGDNLIYTYNQNDWGAQATLGEMGSDCTEYADLTIALSRAAEIPARYYEGLLYLENKTDELAKTEHAWLDAYLPGSGWVALDPTLGRALANRDTYFAHYTPNHIIVTTGRNPSTLRGASYWTHLYWPGDSTVIRVQDAGWTITPSP
jgi:transglutaminase-like putative cysteine protease